eukprot:6658987-Karenia_brevis.AAC.1
MRQTRALTAGPVEKAASVRPAPYQVVALAGQGGSIPGRHRACRSNIVFPGFCPGRCTARLWQSAPVPTEPTTEQ